MQGFLIGLRDKSTINRLYIKIKVFLINYSITAITYCCWFFHTYLIRLTNFLAIRIIARCFDLFFNRLLNASVRAGSCRTATQAASINKYLRYLLQRLVRPIIFSFLSDASTDGMNPIKAIK